MMHTALFHWHKSARLFAGNAELMRPNTADARGFRAILAGSLTDTLCALGSAIRAGDPFSISDHASQPLTAASADFLTFTGGTSGAPKAICRSQASWITSFEVNQSLFGWQAGQHVATLGAPVHSLALYAVIEALHLGLHAHVLAGLAPHVQRADLAKHGTQTIYATPAQLRLLTRGRPTGPLHSVTRILCGGGTLDLATQKAAQDLCPNAHIHQFYGAAETSFVTLTDTQTPQGSVGKAYPGVTLDIRGSEVWAHSPYLFKGYASPVQHIPTSADGFVCVGELGRLDAAGNLWITGRKSRLVQIADQSVSPEKIEQFIVAHFGVQNCAVLPVADAARGHRLAVLLHGPDDHTLAAKILALCRTEFGPLVAPRRIVFTGNWPTLASGKTDFTRLAPLLEPPL